MNVRPILFAAIVCPVVFAISAPSLAATYDAYGDFSITNGNPNGVWAYGWSTTLTSSLNLSTSGFVASNGNEVWDDPNHVSQGAPDVVANTTVTQNGVVPAHSAAFHPGQSDEFSHFVWTAPTAGSFSIASMFTPLDTGGTDVHVLHHSMT